MKNKIDHAISMRLPARNVLETRMDTAQRNLKYAIAQLPITFCKWHAASAHITRGFAAFFYAGFDRFVRVVRGANFLMRWLSKYE